MKIPARQFMKAAARKRAREGPSDEQRPAAPRRPVARTPEPLAVLEPPTAPAIDLTVDTSPEAAAAEGAAVGGSTAEEAAMAEEPPAPGNLAPAEFLAPCDQAPPRATRSWGEGPSGAGNLPPDRTPTSSPPRPDPRPAEAAEESRTGSGPPRGSYFEDGRWAERRISSILLPAAEEELGHMKSSAFFRESYKALVRLAHTLSVSRTVLHGDKVLIREAQKESEEARTRAEAAEKALEAATAARASEIKAAEEALEAAATARADELKAAEEAVKAAEKKAEAEANRLRTTLDQLMETENTVQARNLHISELSTAVQAAEVQVSGATERAVKAEEEAGRAREAERAAIAALTAERETRAAEVEASIEARIARAIEEFKSSEHFSSAVVEASAEAYLHGFRRGKEKVARELDIPQALEVEPDRLSEIASDDEPAPAEP